MGSAYWMIFSIQLLLTINMVNGVFYEGAMSAGYFNEEEIQTWTVCMYLCTCCQYERDDAIENGNGNSMDRVKNIDDRDDY